MQKILVLVKKDCISFSTYNREISEDNLNNTNVINTKNLKFTEEYIIENIELISTFLNLIVIKSNLDKVMISSMDIAETVLILLKRLDKIKYIYFKEDKELNYTISSLLLENKNIEKINCYNMPEIMFYRFKNNSVKTRCEILFTSDFMNYNNINTYSELFNKDKITINEYLSTDDVDDIMYFFKTNKGLKKIEIKRYTQNNLIWILKQLQNNSFRKVNIIIFENSNTTSVILKDISLFSRLNKEYNVNITIKYSKEYKEKNKVKELNIVMFRNIILFIVLLSIIFIGLYKFIESKDNKNIDNNIDSINKIINDVFDESQVIDSEEVEDNDSINYVSPYYTKYNQIYDELLKLNSDTIGWIKVNNTKIDYPVVQTIDNSYYLEHSFDKIKNAAGWVFADYRNDFNNLSKNTIIYAHNMRKKGLMFGTLKNALSEEWYNNDSNLNISFSVKGENINWRVFSIYTIDKTNDYLITDFSSDNSFEKYIKMVKDRSINNFNVDIGRDDNILTLSTCYEDAEHRLVVHAKKI